MLPQHGPQLDPAGRASSDLEIAIFAPTGSSSRSQHYVNLPTDDGPLVEREGSRRTPLGRSDDPCVVMAQPLPPGETWWQRLWQLLVDTANPRTTHTENLTPAELQKQASFESFDYYKSYPSMYLTYLRSKKREVTGQAGAAAVNAGAAAAMEPSSAVRRAAQSSDCNSDTDVSPRQDADNSLGALSPSNVMPRINMSLAADEAERHTALRWFLHVLIALSVGVVATVISYAVDGIENYRADMLSRIIREAPSRFVGYATGFVAWLLLSITLVLIATGVVVYLEPAASGGGIPDVMAYLNGVHVRNAMNIKTFFVKAISCVCAVAGGLPVGLEAPLIHLGAITGAGVTQGRSRSLGFQTTFFQAFRNNKDRRDFITAGAACGVSAAFGAPIGGLLFVMEEVSSFWDHSASGQTFLATMLCFTVTTVITSLVEDNRLLGWVSNTASVLFEVNLRIPLHLISIAPSLLLGAILGALAAFFTKVNLILIKLRRRMLKPYPKRRVLETVVVAVVYSSLMYTLTLLSDCRSLKVIEDVNDTAHVWGTEGAGRLFNDTCRSAGAYSPLGTLNMATGKNTIRHLFTRQTVGEFPVYYLIIYFILYFVFACISSGMAISGGLVVPSLVIGAVFGRLFGLLLWYVGANRGVVAGVDRSYSTTDAWMDPGVFALIGAGAFLAGTSRMAMSICVIMVELSSELHYLLPVMVAIVMSKTVADWLCEPLYHEMLHLDNVPYLSAALPLPEFEQLTAADVMATNVVVLRRRERTEVVLRALRDTTHHAFPVVVEVGGYKKEEPGAHTGNTPPSQRQREEEESSLLSSTVHSPSRIRGLDSGSSFSAFPPTVPHAHLKCVGLVTREDLQVYLTLPQLRSYEPGVEASLAQQVSSRYSGATEDEYSDGFGGRLAQCVVNINHMTWTQWLMHKASLFLLTRDRQDWLEESVLAGGPSFGPAVAGQDNGGGDATPVKGDGGGPHTPQLPPVLDLTIIINRSPWVIPPSFNLQMAYHTFRTMGLRHMIVIDGDAVKGMITRKDLLVDSLRRRMKELRTRLDQRESGGATRQANARLRNASANGAVADHSSSPHAAPFPPPSEKSGSAHGQQVSGGDVLQGLIGDADTSRVRGPGTVRTQGPTSSSATQASRQPMPLLWDV